MAAVDSINPDEAGDYQMIVLHAHTLVTRAQPTALTDPERPLFRVHAPVSPQYWWH